MISEVYNTDCIKGMKHYPDKFFDLAVVDPPYGTGLDMINNSIKRNPNGQKRRSIHKNKDWNNQIPGREYFLELHRVSKHQIIWGCNYYARYIPAVGRIIHDKMMSTEGHDKIKFSDADLASCSLQKRITMFRYQWSGNRQNGTVNWNNTGDDARIHPTQKPLALYKWILKHYAKPGNKILDTHMGSQSSRIAAYDMGFDYWGFEIDTEYFQAGCKRFEDFKNQLKLF